MEADIDEELAVIFTLNFCLLHSVLKIKKVNISINTKNVTSSC